MSGLEIILLSVVSLGTLCISIAAFQKANLNSKRIMVIHEHHQKRFKAGLE